MKIVLTGGGTGGHFYPLIAIAEKLNQLADERKVLSFKMYYFSDAPYDKSALFDNGLEFRSIPAGKLRLYFSIQNFFDVFKTATGILKAIVELYTIYPDVVVAKGGYASFPTLFAARILRIPVIIHESDSIPGRVNKWAGKFAARIAVSYAETGEYFPKNKVAHTGQPIRGELIKAAPEGAFEYLDMDSSLPVLFIVGGSQGAEIINNIVIDILPKLVEKYQIIHQTGIANFESNTTRANFLLSDSLFKTRYKPFAFLNPLAMKMAAGASTLIISRAGSMIFEIASWGVPTILIPITNSNGDHQRKNAYNYARAGGGIVIEESHFDGAILQFEIEQLLNAPERLQEMKKSALVFAKGDAARTIADEIISIALEHEK